MSDQVFDELLLQIADNTLKKFIQHDLAYQTVHYCLLDAVVRLQH